MRTMRSGGTHVAIAVALLMAGTSGAMAQDLSATPGSPPGYPVTLRYGTGLIDIPTAWISPNNGDMWLGAAGTQISCNGCSSWNANLTLETHWIERFSLGFSLYSNNPEWGFFGQFLALREDPKSWQPSVSVGFRNLGPYNHEERLLIGHDVQYDSGGGTTQVNPPWAQGFHTAPTFYLVLTKDWSVGKNGTVGATLGYGNGIFSQDGGLGNNYNDKGTIVKGLFLGGRYAYRPSEAWSFDFMLENNGFDWNAGAVANWKGVFLGLYATELEEGGMSPSHGSMYQVYNYTKFNLTLGFSTNLFLASKGQVLRSQVAELKQQESQLNAEIANREAKIAALELQLQKAQAGELAETSKRREQLDAQIQEEKEAIRRAEERLQQLQGAQKPPAPPPAPPPASGSTPPREP